MTPIQDTQLREKITFAHKAFANMLYKRAFFKVQDKETSADLVQDTFIKTWRYLVKGGQIDTMKAFLYHILNNLIVDEYRKHKTASLDFLVEQGFQPKTNDSERLFDIIDGKAIMLLIQKLPQIYRRVLELRYEQEFSLKEIAIITGQPVNTITVQAYRALIKLRHLYGESIKNPLSLAGNA